MNESRANPAFFPGKLEAWRRWERGGNHPEIRDRMMHFHTDFAQIDCLGPHSLRHPGQPTNAQMPMIRSIAHWRQNKGSIFCSRQVLNRRSWPSIRSTSEPKSDPRNHSHGIRSCAWIGCLSPLRGTPHRMCIGCETRNPYRIREKVVAGVGFEPTTFWLQSIHA